MSDILVKMNKNFNQNILRGCNFNATKTLFKTATNNRINFPFTTTITTTISFATSTITPAKNTTTNILKFKKINNSTIIKQIHLWSIILLIFLILMNVIPMKTNAMLVRHRKRHSSNSLHVINPNLLEWENPCGGKYLVHNNVADISSSSRKIAFRNLRRSIRANNQRLLTDERLSAIDISDISTWVKLNHTYKFLTQVKPNSNINLTRWHRSLQVYVASFAYLRKKQEKVDHKYNKYDNRPISIELKKLLNNAINVLCEIETAINATTNRTLQIITRNDMDNRLTFRTKSNILNTEYYNGDLIELDQIDLKFAKARYYEFINNIGKILRKWIKQQRRKKLCRINGGDNASNGSSNNNEGGSSSSNSSDNSGSINSSDSGSISNSNENSINKNERNPCRNFLRKRNRHLNRKKF